VRLQHVPALTGNGANRLAGVARRGNTARARAANEKEKEMADPKQFLKDYQALILGVWQNTGEEAKLVADPTGYAKLSGLPVEAGKTVVLDRSQPEGMLDGKQLIEAWNAEGQHTLYVPATPLINFDELSEDELESVSGALAVIVIVIP
jgi:hypothetical protein